MTPSPDRTTFGIAMICAAVFAISLNDMLIKLLSGDYPLHQLVMARTAFGLILTLCFLRLEGGLRLLKTDTPWLHLLRALLVVAANSLFYAAVAVLTLAQATALFFVAPLFITLLSIPILGEKVGPWRMGAVIVGLLGVVVMQEPWDAQLPVSRWVLLLPVAAALCYAGMQVLTRKLGVTAKASALAVYIQVTFLTVSGLVWLVAGDGRYANTFDNESARFLLRPWIWPSPRDWLVMAGLGFLAGTIGYTLSSAYKSAPAATIAPFEYIGLPLAILWGWSIFGEWPGLPVWLGCLLIVGAGLVVLYRERKVKAVAVRTGTARR